MWCDSQFLPGTHDVSKKHVCVSYLLQWICDHTEHCKLLCKQVHISLGMTVQRLITVRYNGMMVTLWAGSAAPPTPQSLGNEQIELLSSVTAHDKSGTESLHQYRSIIKNAPFLWAEAEASVINSSPTNIIMLNKIFIFKRLTSI